MCGRERTRGPDVGASRPLRPPVTNRDRRPAGPRRTVRSILRKSAIRQRFTANYNTRYANTPAAGSGIDWFFYQPPTTLNEQEVDGLPALIGRRFSRPDPAPGPLATPRR